MSVNREVTIYDIARELGLSPSTISRGLRSHPAIKDETVRRIKETADSMGYQQNTFASNLRRNRSNTIGVILPRLSSSFQSAVISGMEEVAAKNGYHLLISQSGESVEKEKVNIKTMYDSRADGLLLSLAADAENLDHLELFLKKGIPLVLFDRTKEHPDYESTSVVIDNRKAGYDVTHHLIEQGCERILHVCDNLLSNVYTERYDGYKDALNEHGFTVDPDLVVIDTLDEGSGARIVKRIQAMERRPDAVFAANDISAVTVICELKKAGIMVPREIAVAGFNNVHISRVVEPELTTMHYPGVEMGKVAATMLIEMMNQDQPVVARTIVMEHELVIRGSSLKKR
ncbi:MAG: LacI family DNA-binding transcriptional regulator [Bacteroidota bacterium]